MVCPFSCALIADYRNEPQAQVVGVGAGALHNGAFLQAMPAASLRVLFIKPWCYLHTQSGGQELACKNQPKEHRLCLSHCAKGAMCCAFFSTLAHLSASARQI